MGLLEQGAKWLEDRRMSGLTVPATYVRRGGLRIDVDATVGRTLFRAEDQYGITVRIESRDFLVSAEQLPDEPERGDTIILWGKRYEVLAPNNEPVWRWSGPDNLVRRIHTKEIGDENGE